MDLKKTQGRPGEYKELDPYNDAKRDPKLFDLRNTLGPFDVKVTRNADGSTTFAISDVYTFGAKENDKKKQGQHGFQLPFKSDSLLGKIAQKLLPNAEYQNPGGYTENEKFEIKELKGETTLLIPQQ